MRQRRRFHQDHKEPYILLSPMIDLIFLLLVTFIAGTMYTLCRYGFQRQLIL